MNFAQVDEEGWPKYVAWTAFAAVCTAIGTELGKWIVEEIKDHRKKLREREEI